MFKENLKNRGLKIAIQKEIQRFIGMREYQEQIDSLYYFLNKYADITKLPTAEGKLRDLQLCDIQLLGIFHEVCKQNNLEYWLDYGTLLGLYRHKGFIPWDDDVDVCMMRDDYERAVKLLPDLLGRYGIDAKEEENEPSVRIGIGYKHKLTGVWIDVFPIDALSDVDGSQATTNTLREKIRIYKTFYKKNKDKISREKLAEKRNTLIQGFPKGTVTFLYHGPEFMYPKILIHKKNSVFPLSKSEFDGVEVRIPNDPQSYLTGIYGSSYMEFPKSGVEHHGSEQGKLSEWASINNVDMHEIHRELRAILEDIRKEDVTNESTNS